MSGAKSDRTQSWTFVLSSMASVTLNNGTRMPSVGLGTWQSKPGEVQKAVKSAIEVGYRLIDCAFVYGNEREVGEAIKEVINNGTVVRSDLYVVSKLWNTQHHKVDVRPSLKKSLEYLGTDYIDLYLIHWPIAFKAGGELFPRDEHGNVIYDDVDYLETWKVLEELVDEGLIRSIGLSNFNSQQVKNVIDNSRIKPSVLQVEVHPYFGQHKLVDFCRQNNVVVMAYSCLGSPARPWAATDGHSQSLLDDPVLVDMAKQHGKTSAQVVIRWLVQRGVVPIPKSVTPSRIEANFQVFDFELSDEEVKTIDGLNRNLRLIVPMVERDGKKEYRDKDAPRFPFLVDF